MINTNAPLVKSSAGLRFVLLAVSATSYLPLVAVKRSQSPILFWRQIGPSANLYNPPARCSSNPEKSDESAPMSAVGESSWCRSDCPKDGTLRWRRRGRDRRTGTAEHGRQ